MQDLMNNFSAHMSNEATWVGYWINFMGVILLLSIPFSFVRKEARLILAGFVMGAALVFALFHIFGYQKIMGLGHVLIWGPIVVYLWRKRSEWRVRETLSGKWIVLAVLVMSISLVFDITDVIRYAMGHRM